MVCLSPRRAATPPRAPFFGGACGACAVLGGAVRDRVKALQE